MATALRSVILLALSIFMLCMAIGCGKPRIDLAVASQPNVNPDHSGRPSPVVVKMYELSGDLAFKQSDFSALFHEPVKALGTDLIAADELVFVPSEARTISYEPMEKTRFVGVVAGFRQIERAQWRAIIPVNPEEKSTIRLELLDASLVIITDSKWDPEKNLRTQHTIQTQPEPQTPEARPAESSASPKGTSPAGSVTDQGQPQGYVLLTSKRAQ